MWMCEREQKKTQCHLFNEKCNDGFGLIRWMGAALQAWNISLKLQNRWIFAHCKTQNNYHWMWPIIILRFRHGKNWRAIFLSSQVVKRISFLSLPKYSSVIMRFSLKGNTKKHLTRILLVDLCYAICLKKKRQFSLKEATSERTHVGLRQQIQLCGLKYVKAF